MRCPSAKTAPGPAKIWFWPLRALPVCLRCGRLRPNRSAGHLSIFTRKAPPLYRTRTRPKIWPLHGSIKKQPSPFCGITLAVQQLVRTQTGAPGLAGCPLLQARRLRALAFRRPTRKPSTFKTSSPHSPASSGAFIIKCFLIGGQNIALAKEAKTAF